MIHRLAAALPAGLLLAAPVVAQDFRGAEIAAEALSFGEDGVDMATNYRAGVEVGILGFGLEADVAQFQFGEGDDSLRNVTVHASTDLLPFGTTGLFYARESSDDLSSNTYGIEAAASLAGADVNGFVGFGDAEGDDFTVAGVDGAYAITPSISAIASGALLDVDGGRVGRLAVGGEYRFGGTGPALYAEVGRLGADEAAFGVSDGSAFVGLGARIALGANGGTTFGARGPGDVVSGF